MTANLSCFHLAKTVKIIVVLSRSPTFMKLYCLFYFIWIFIMKIINWSQIVVLNVVNKISLFVCCCCFFFLHFWCHHFGVKWSSIHVWSPTFLYSVEVVTAKLQTLKLSFSFLSRYRPFVPHIPFDFYVVSKNTTLLVLLLNTTNHNILPAVVGR